MLLKTLIKSICVSNKSNPSILLSIEHLKSYFSLVIISSFKIVEINSDLCSVILKKIFLKRYSSNIVIFGTYKNLCNILYNESFSCIMIKSEKLKFKTFLKCDL